MSCYKKQRKQRELPLQQFEEIIYKPCKLCGSLDYDQGDNDIEQLEKENVFEPNVCDVCCYGNVSQSSIPLH